MPVFRLALAGLLLGVPLATLAQSPAAAPPKFYAGLAAYVSDYQSINSTGRGFPVSLQATLGYQWRPRLAVQVGLAYRGSAYTYDESPSRDYLGNGRYGPPYENILDVRFRSLSASLLGRYTLTRQAAHRLQFDVLAGFTLEHTHNIAYQTRTDSATAPVASTTAYNRSTLLATAGLGVRYRFGPRLEATYNLLLSTTLADLTSSPGYYRGSSSMALGVQYRFGRR